MYGEKGLSDQSLVSCYLSVFKANSTLLVQIEFRQTTVENCFGSRGLPLLLTIKKEIKNSTCSSFSIVQLIKV